VGDGAQQGRLQPVGFGQSLAAPGLLGQVDALQGQRRLAHAGGQQPVLRGRGRVGEGGAQRAVDRLAGLEQHKDDGQTGVGVGRRAVGQEVDFLRAQIVGHGAAQLGADGRRVGQRVEGAGQAVEHLLLAGIEAGGLGLGAGVGGQPPSHERRGQKDGQVEQFARVFDGQGVVGASTDGPVRQRTAATSVASR